MCACYNRSCSRAFSYFFFITASPIRLETTQTKSTLSMFYPRETFRSHDSWEVERCKSRVTPVVDIYIYVYACRVYTCACIYITDTYGMFTCVCIHLHICTSSFDVYVFIFTYMVAEFTCVCINLHICTPSLQEWV